ncbi:hypothetical protein M3699_12425 [Peribacillus simplex]|nr:hypothetical protein [Peribacillus simplex]MCM3674670.1 hypothetical protein [Peribacillus simplex]
MKHTQYGLIILFNTNKESASKKNIFTSSMIMDITHKGYFCWTLNKRLTPLLAAHKGMTILGMMTMVHQETVMYSNR